MSSLEKAISTKTVVECDDPVLPTLASTGPQIPREDIIRCQSSRGLKKKDHYVLLEQREIEGSRRKRKASSTYPPPE